MSTEAWWAMVVTQDACGWQSFQAMTNTRENNTYSDFIHTPPTDGGLRICNHLS